MAAGARLIPPSPKPAGGPVSPPVRAPRIKFAKAARNPKFLRVIAQLQQSAKKVGTHPPAQRKAAEAQAAAKAPPNEKEAGARANQVDDMKDAKAEKPNKGGFLAILRAEIQKVMPKTNEDATKFMKGGEAEQVKGAVGSNVSEQKQKAAGPTEQATKAPPDTGKVEAKEVTPVPSDPAVAAPPVAGAAAMPDPKPQAEVQKAAQDASTSADQKLKDAELTGQQLTKANDPRFSSVLTTRDKVKTTAAAGATKYRANENKALGQAKAGAAGAAAQGAAALSATKKATGEKTGKQQQTAKEKDEDELRKLTADITAIFDKTKSQVEKKLATLEQDAMALFDRGTDAALARMKSSAEAEIDRFKGRRYSGLDGAALWLIDRLRDTLPEIKEIIARSRQRFTVEMDQVAVSVAAVVDGRLAEAKAIVSTGQAAVSARAAKLSPHLKAKGAEATEALTAKFDELKQSIDDKAQDLAEKLAQKYKDASEKADAAAKEMEDANKGALKALADKVGEIVKMLAEFADRVLSLFKKAAGVVKKIVADPIAFLGNLLSAIKQGISKFVSNIWTHIKKGFMSWLFGELTKGGVQIPDGLPAPGALVKLVLNVMGLTWANIRPKIVKKIGEKAVSILEKVVEILQKLFTGGPEALWAEMEAFVGNLKGMVLDAILDWVITKVITSAITKVASMFNPAGAIIQAIIMVYNVGSWLVANIGKILDFIESVVNSVDRIANGDVGGAASFIEQALARMIPILIGFLAGLLGLGGLGDKIKSFIKKVQAAVGKAVDFVIDKVFNFVKKIIGKITGKDKKGEEALDPEKEKKVKAGIDALGQEESTHKDKGKIEREEADKVAAKIKGQHPVFKSLKVIDGGATWDYDYVASPGRVRKGAGKAGDVRDTVVTHTESTGRASNVIADPLTAKGPDGSNASKIQNVQIFKDYVKKKTTRLGVMVFNQIKGVHLLASKLHGPATSWNLGNAGTSINEKMKKPEKEAIKLKDMKGVELKYTTTVKYHTNTPPPAEAERDRLQKKTKKAGLKALIHGWLGFYLAKSFSVAIEVLKKPPSSKATGGSYGPFASHIDKELPLLYGPPPKRLDVRVHEAAVGTADSASGRVIPLRDLAQADGVNENAADVGEALQTLVAAKKLWRKCRFYYVRKPDP